MNGCLKHHWDESAVSTQHVEDQQMTTETAPRPFAGIGIPRFAMCLAVLASNLHFMTGPTASRIAQAVVGDGPAAHRAWITWATIAYIIVFTAAGLLKGMIKTLGNDGEDLVTSLVLMYGFGVAFGYAPWVLAAFIGLFPPVLPW